jgi:hypothetical protein
MQVIILVQAISCQFIFTSRCYVTPLLLLIMATVIAGWRPPQLTYNGNSLTVLTDWTPQFVLHIQPWYEPHIKYRIQQFLCFWVDTMEWCLACHHLAVDVFSPFSLLIFIQHVRLQYYNFSLVSVFIPQCTFLFYNIPCHAHLNT